MNTQNTDIKTGWDLKLALEKIIQVIDANGSMFSALSAEEKHTVDHFAKSLAVRRAEIKTAMEYHMSAMEAEILPLNDRCDAIRAKLRNITGTLGDLPDRYQLERFTQTADALNQIARISDESFDRMAKVVAIARQK